MTCAVLPFESVYNNTNNTTEFVLLENDVPIIDLSAISRITILIGTKLVDSLIVPAGTITWNNTTEYYGQTVQIITMQLGFQGLLAGDYNGCRLTIYDPANPNGVIWSDTINIRVKD